MTTRLAIALFTAALTVVGADGASAKSAGRDMVMGGAMAEGGYVLPPITFTKFCLDYPGECAGGPARVHMDASRMEVLEQVNRQVNAAIEPTPDTSRFRFWKLNVSRGDCNNYAIQKRHELIKRGWPAGALSLSVVKTGGGEGHLVVSVRTDAGDYVLDNLRSHVVEWRRAGYRWEMRQSAENPRFWVALDGGRPASATDAQADEAAIATADLKETQMAAQPFAPPASSPGRRYGRGMILGLLNPPDFAAPIRELAPTLLNLTQSESELTLAALPRVFNESDGADDNPTMSFATNGHAWVLRGSLEPRQPV